MLMSRPGDACNDPAVGACGTATTAIAFATACPYFFKPGSMFQDRHFRPLQPKRPIRRYPKIWLPIIVTSSGLLLIGAALAGANLRILWVGSTFLSVFVTVYAFSVGWGRRGGRSDDREPR